MKNKKVIIGIITAAAIVIVLVLLWIFVIDRPVVPGQKGNYTYRYADDEPESFSPLNWSSDAERDILSYTTSSLYVVTEGTASNMEPVSEVIAAGVAEAIIESITAEATESPDDTEMPQEAEAVDEDIQNDSGAILGYEPLLAASMPEDVTADYAGNEIYGVSENATEGYAYRVTIRDDAVWSDGTSISTADFEYSLQLYLSDDCEHKSDYYNSYAAIANAKEYTEDSFAYVYDSDDGYADVEDSELYFSMTQTNALLKTCSLQEYYAYYSQDKTSLFIDDENKNIYEELKAAVGDEDYVQLTNDIKDLLQSFCRNYGLDDDEAYKRLCFYKDEENVVSWDAVGFIVEDDYNMVFVLEKQVTEQEFISGLSDLLLVQRSVYESDSAAYGTTAENYVSYGPYLIVSYDENGMELSKNENWFGYSDEAYDGLYQTTDIEITYGLSTEDAEAKFIEGNLDQLNLFKNADGTFADSVYAVTQDNSATVMLSMNIDMNSLEDKSGDGENHTILAYKDFRHAISLAIDRDAYMASVNPSGTTAYGLFNSSYIIDLSEMLAYRDTEDAAAVIESIYGEADENGIISYYNVENAAELIQSAYDACLMDYNIKTSDTVVIDCYALHTGVVEFLQEALDEASAGTSLEGKITVRSVETVSEADVYEDVVSGDMLDVYASLQQYLDPDYAADDGFCMGIQKRTITIDDEDVSKTYGQWYQLLMLGEYSLASTETKLSIVASLEKGLLATYKNIPIYDMCETYIDSQRIQKGDVEYAQTMGDEIRYMTYSMDDKEWSDYCKKAKNALDY